MADNNITSFVPLNLILGGEKNSGNNTALCITQLGCQISNMTLIDLELEYNFVDGTKTHLQSAPQ